MKSISLMTATRKFLVTDPSGKFHLVEFIPESRGSYYSEDGWWGAENLPDPIKVVLEKKAELGNVYYIAGYEIKEIDIDD